MTSLTRRRLRRAAGGIVAFRLARSPAFAAVLALMRDRDQSLDHSSGSLDEI